MEYIKINNFFLTIVLLLTVLHYNVNNVMCDINLLILHNNDMHAHIEETSLTSSGCQNTKSGKCFGGFARIKKTVQDIRDDQKEKTNVLFLNAGDTFQGTPYYSIFKWEVIADFIDLLGIDVMSLGNHEFDDSPKGLAPYLKSIKTVSVAANINITNEPCLDVPTLKPYQILDVNGTQIAIIGYLTPVTQELEDTGKVIFKNEVESIKENIEYLKTKGIKIFIALGHSGYAEDLEIAKNVPDIDLVVGGHTNTFLYNGNPPSTEIPVGPYPTVVTQSSNRKVPVVQAFAFTKYLGYLNLVFDDDGEVKNFSGNPLLLDNSYSQDEEILEKVNQWRLKIQNITDTILGVTKVYLDAHYCKLKECNIGNLISDALVDYNAQSYNGEGWTDASVGLTLAGGIRSSIDASEREGNITYGDVMLVLPFEDKLVKGKILGKHLLEVLEFSVHRYEKTGHVHVGEFLQVSGLIIAYDISKPPGERVMSVKVRCDNCTVPKYLDLEPDKEYSIIINTYLARGGDNVTTMRDHLYNFVEINITDTDAVANYIRKFSPIYPKITNRITVLNSIISTTISPVTEGTTHHTEYTTAFTNTTNVTTASPEISTTTEKGSAAKLRCISSLVLFIILYLLQLW